MAYCVIRTDNLSGTHQCADLVSVRFCTASTAEGVTTYTPADVENGVIVELKGYEAGEREVQRAVAATSSSDLTACAIVAGVELMYDERLRALDQFVNKAGRAARGYLLRRGNTFSVTKEGFVGGTVPAVGDTVGVGTGGKLDKSGSDLGKCIAIETAGKYTFYVIQIGNIDINGVE